MGHFYRLVTSWDSEIFELSNLETLHGCLGITLKNVSNGFIFNIFNIYGSQSSKIKRKLWERMAKVSLATANSHSIFIGFNCTRLARERLFCIHDARNSRFFNTWIDQSNLVELHISNVKLT